MSCEDEKLMQLVQDRVRPWYHWCQISEFSYQCFRQ